MSPHDKLVDSTLVEFADKLAARTATPGGGSMAAYLAACAAALVSMGYRFTSGEKFAAAEEAMAERASKLDALRKRALELVDADSSSYDGVTAAYGLPKANETQKVERAAAIQAALKHALETPFETMQTALEVLRLAAAGAPDVNKNLASDCAVGASCASAALEGAFLNVRINALSIKDEHFVQMRMKSCDAMRAEARDLSAALENATGKHLS